MTTPLLEGYRRCCSSDPERMQAYLDTVGFRVEALRDDDAPLDMRVNGVYLPGMYIGYTQYGKAATIRAAPERTDYWLLLPVHGKLEARVRKDLVDCDPRRGVLSDPSRTGQLVRSETGCGRLNIILTETAVRRQLGALLGMPLSRSPDFEPAIDVAQGHGRNLAGYLRLAIDDFERDAAMLSSPIAMQQFEQMVFTNLLLSHPHSYTQSLRRLAKSVASGDVKRALDYMEANLTSPIGLPDITAAAGVPGRTLLEHFRRYKGTSPMGYLRHARFCQGARSVGLCRAGREHHAYRDGPRVQPHGPVFRRIPKALRREPIGNVAAPPQSSVRRQRSIVVGPHPRLPADDLPPGPAAPPAPA